MAELRRTCNEARQRTSKHKHKRPKWNLLAASCPKSPRTSYFMAAKCCASVWKYEYNPFDLQHSAIHHCIAGDMKIWYLVLDCCSCCWQRWWWAQNGFSGMVLSGVAFVAICLRPRLDQGPRTKQCTKLELHSALRWSCLNSASPKRCTDLFLHQD